MLQWSCVSRNWKLNITVVFLDVNHCPAFYLKHATSRVLDSKSTFWWNLLSWAQSTGCTSGFLLWKQLPCPIQTWTLNDLNTYPDGNNAHKMAVVHKHSVHHGMLQLYEARILHDAATRVLQRICIHKSLSSIAAVKQLKSLHALCHTVYHNAKGNHLIGGCAGFRTDLDVMMFSLSLHCLRCHGHYSIRMPLCIMCEWTPVYRRIWTQTPHLSHLLSGSLFLYLCVPPIIAK
jgi:hypothetical protein